MSVCKMVEIDQANPELIVDQHIQSLLVEGQSLLLLVNYPFEQYWLADKPVLSLSAVYCLTLVEGEGDISFTVSESSEGLVSSLQAIDPVGDFSKSDFP